MAKKNIVMFDNDAREHTEYLKGIRAGSGLKWEAKVCIANQQQRTKLDRLVRYIKYFVYPFSVFLKRKNYNIVVGWQAFYAINYAFYCHLFHVKKVNKVVIQHLVYRPKKGFTGKIYEKYMKFAINNKYVDIVQTEAEGYMDYLHNYLGIPMKKIVHVPFGVNDFSKWEESDRKLKNHNYVLAIGRSNRDWKYVAEQFKTLETKLIIICDSLNFKCDSDNITVVSCNGTDTLPYFKQCLCSIIAVEDGKASSGDTVFCQSLCFGKPTIVIRPCSLERNYLIENYNGYAVDRNQIQLKEALNKLLDKDNYKMITSNCRKDYEEKYSLYVHAKRIGQIAKELN